MITLNTATRSLRTVVAPHERALCIRDRAIVDVRGPGVYWTLPFVSRESLRIVDASVARADIEHIDVLVATQPALVAAHFVDVDLGDAEAALVFENDRLTDVLSPGTRALYWQGVVDVRIERVDIAENYRVDAAIARLIGRSGPLARRPGAVEGLLGVEVAERQVGLLYDSGVLLEVLSPGYHVFWKFNRKLTAKVVDARWTIQEVAGQEILTRDRVSLRINLSAAWRVVDPVRVEQSVRKVDEYVYRELQLALRQAVGTRTLDELLTDKSVLDDTLGEAVGTRLGEIGVETGSIGVKDIILPGDMKDILNQVVLAEKTAQANNIRRREETAATRSLMNTAKLMADNPLLVRLKELEALEKVTGNVDRLTVYGGMDGVMHNLVSLAPSAED